MSRTGSIILTVPEGVTVTVYPQEIIAVGKLGEDKISLATKFMSEIDVKLEDGKISTSIKSEQNKSKKEYKAVCGTINRLINNLLEGVSTGFNKEIYMVGVGYKAEIKDDQLVLTAGFSHLVYLDIPNDIKVEVNKNKTEFNISGINKQAVGDFADKVVKTRKPDPYGGKGVHYKGKPVRRKETKKK
ncbi:MAG: 50S ribosomal protein L6 [Alphaproteobacteria bacterium]|nr:50S ribosomal protein L6 [Alphaproteobacteria bacterium]MBL0718180.1 50S ribosomal protein L6 [Alphaproteobacteria bacterium]